MDIQFLRPELEHLHVAAQQAYAMMGTEVGLEVFLYESSYAAPAGDHFADEGLYLETLLPYLAKCCPARASVLDVGAGTGRVALPLAQAGYHVTMLEPAASGLRLAHAKAEEAGVASQLSYVCGYASDVGALGEDAFDAVLGLRSLTYEPDLKATLTALLRASQRALCFDVYSRYGFLAGRMSSGYAHTAGYTPETILYVLDEHRTPGEKSPDAPDPLALYTSGEVAQLAREAGLLVDEVRAVSYGETFEWQDGSDEAAVSELERRMREDPVLRELGACHLVLGRKPGR